MAMGPSVLLKQTLKENIKKKQEISIPPNDIKIIFN